MTTNSIAAARVAEAGEAASEVAVATDGVEVVEEATAESAISRSSPDQTYTAMVS